MDKCDMLKALKWGVKEIHGLDIDDDTAEKVLTRFNRKREK